MDEYTQSSADHRTVNSNTAFPDVENADGIGSIPIPFKGAVVKTGADNGEGGDPQHAVQQIVLGNAEFLAALQGIGDGQDQTQGDHQTVKADLEAADGETGGGI